MKKHIHLMLERANKTSTYHKKHCDKELGFISLFIREMSADWVLELIEGPADNFRCSVELLCVDWSKKYNGVIIRWSSLFQDENDKNDFFIMKFCNFKKMLEKWKELKDQNAPNIYFIERPNGNIFVQENLDDNIPKNHQKKMHFKMDFDKDDDYWIYKKGSAVEPELELLFLLAKNYEPEYIAKDFHKKNRKIEGNDTEIHWSQGSNSVAIYSDDNFSDFYTLKFDNFKSMIESWGELYEKRAPEIYFIQEDDGTISVQDKLDNN